MIVTFQFLIVAQHPLRVVRVKFQSIHFVSSVCGINSELRQTPAIKHNRIPVMTQLDSTWHVLVALAIGRTNTTLRRQFIYYTSRCVSSRPSSITIVHSNRPTLTDEFNGVNFSINLGLYFRRGVRNFTA